MARSLAEGFDETLTLHRLGLYGVLGRSLKTTNCLESVNALVEERCAKVDHWQNSRQRHRCRDAKDRDQLSIAEGCPATIGQPDRHMPAARTAPAARPVSTPPTGRRRAPTPPANRSAAGVRGR